MPGNMRTALSVLGVLALSSFSSTREIASTQENRKESKMNTMQSHMNQKHCKFQKPFPCSPLCSFLTSSVLEPALPQPMAHATQVLSAQPREAALMATVLLDLVFAVSFEKPFSETFTECLLC